MIIVPTLLIWGATPLDVVAFMLLFVVYNNFTSETQDVRLDYKDLVLFPKWRLLIPLVLTVVGIFINPAIGIAVFMACFVLELLATVFKRIPESGTSCCSSCYCTFRSQCYCNRYWRLCRSYY